VLGIGLRTLHTKLKRYEQLRPQAGAAGSAREPGH
jgi:hypothetical protein